MENINKNEANVELKDMMEITSYLTFDAASDFEMAEYHGLFEEDAFGTAWKEITKDYRGGMDYVPDLAAIKGKDRGVGGYIKLHAPIEGISVIGVVPAELRPIVKDAKTGAIYVHPINTAYSKVISFNSRVTKLEATNAPKILMDNEYRLLTRYVGEVLDYLEELSNSANDDVQELIAKCLKVTK